MSENRSLKQAMLRRLKAATRRKQGSRTLQDAVLRTFEGGEAETASGATVAGIALVAGAVIVSACLPLVVLAHAPLTQTLSGMFMMHAEVFEVLLTPSLAAVLLLPRRRFRESGWVLIAASPFLLAAGDGSWWLDGGTTITTISCASVAAAGAAAGVLYRERRSKRLADDTL